MQSREKDLTMSKCKLFQSFDEHNPKIKKVVAMCATIARSKIAANTFFGYRFKLSIFWLMWKEM